MIIAKVMYSFSKWMQALKAAILNANRMLPQMKPFLESKKLSLSKNGERREPAKPAMAYRMDPKLALRSISAKKEKM